MRSWTIFALLFAHVTVGWAVAWAQEPTAPVIAPLNSPVGADVPASLDGRVIARIDFVPSAQPLSQDELDRLLPMKVGAALRLSDVRAAIQLLFSTGRYADVAMEAEVVGDQVNLRIRTELTYFVSSVVVTGTREPPNENQLITASQFEIGAPFRSEAVLQAQKNISDRLQANGLYKATVVPTTEHTDVTEEASILFSIESGSRARFDAPRFSGDTSISERSLTRATGWHRSIGPLWLPGWRPITEARVQEGLENVRKKLQGADRLQAQVTRDRLEYDPARNRVTPYLSIASGPLIEVKITGADISEDRKRELVPIYQERSVDRALLSEGARNITEYLQSEGYFDATVTFAEGEASPEKFTVAYNVVQGERHKLVSISITGNQFFDTLKLRERMYIQAASWLRWRHGRYSPNLLERDVNALLSLYRANGFRQVKIVREVQEAPADHTNISLHIRIEEGPQTIVRSLRLEGALEADAEYLKSILRSTEDQAYSEANVAADRDAVLAYYYNNGYLEAAFDSTQENVENNPIAVDLLYEVRPGNRQLVRQVLVRGLVQTDPELVFQRISLVPGGPISQSQIAESQQKLYDLGIFARVQTAVQNPDGVEASKNVIFAAQEARKYSFNSGFGAQLGRIGGGTSSLNSPAGTNGFAPRVSLGVSRINFLGLGHTISLQTLASTQQRRALLNYLAPHFKGRESLSLTVSGLFNDARDIRTFSARRWESSIQLAEKLSRASTVQLRYTFRRVTLGSVNILPELIPLLARPARIALVGGSLFQDRRDDPVDSHRGVYNSIDIGVASKAFGSQTAYSRVLLRNSSYHQIRRDVVLARSVQFGYLQRLGGLADIPLTEHFFSGGASSHRGFPDNQAGPRDPVTGFPVGGQALLLHSTELRFPLIGDNLGGVLFHDMGNVYSDIRNVSFRVRQRNLQDFNYMVHAVGVGIRYRTLVGPVRVDLAYGPNTPRFFGFNGTRDQLLQLNPNTALCSDTSPLCTNQRINRFQFHFSLGQTF